LNTCLIRVGRGVDPLDLAGRFEIADVLHLRRIGQRDWHIIPAAVVIGSGLARGGLGRWGGGDR